MTTINVKLDDDDDDDDEQPMLLATDCEKELQEL